MKIKTPQSLDIHSTVLAGSLIKQVLLPTFPCRRQLMHLDQEAHRLNVVSLQSYASATKITQ